MNRKQARLAFLSSFIARASTFYVWRRRQELNLHGTLLPDCLANSSGYRFRHASKVKESWRRVEDSNPYERSTLRFSRPVPDRFGVLSARFRQEHSESNRKRRFWRPPCCQLHHAPKVSNHDACGRTRTYVVRRRLIYSQVLLLLSHTRLKLCDKNGGGEFHARSAGYITAHASPKGRCGLRGSRLSVQVHPVR
jgi:hypothetical protein